MKRVDEFREIAKEVVSNACYGALLGKGFIVDETQVEQGLLHQLQSISNSLTHCFS